MSFLKKLKEKFNNDSPSPSRGGSFNNNNNNNGGPKIWAMSPEMREQLEKGVRYNMKVVLRGMRRTGKSALMARLHGHAFPNEYAPSPEISAATIRFLPQGEPETEAAKIEIWDVVDEAGRSPSKGRSSKSPKGAPKGLPELPPADASTIDVYRGCTCVVFMIDATRPETLSYAMDEAPNVPPTAVILLIHNFNDAPKPHAVSEMDIDRATKKLQRGSTGLVLQAANGQPVTDPQLSIGASWISMSILTGKGMDAFYAFLSIPVAMVKLETLETQMRGIYRQVEEQQAKLLEIRAQAAFEEKEKEKQLEQRKQEQAAHAEANERRAQAIREANERVAQEAAKNRERLEKERRQQEEDAAARAAAFAAKKKEQEQQPKNLSMTHNVVQQYESETDSDPENHDPSKIKDGFFDDDDEDDMEEGFPEPESDPDTEEEEEDYSQRGTRGSSSNRASVGYEQPVSPAAESAKQVLQLDDAVAVTSEEYSPAAEEKEEEPPRTPTPEPPSGFVARTDTPDFDLGENNDGMGDDFFGDDSDDEHQEDEGGMLPEDSEEDDDHHGAPKPTIDAVASMAIKEECHVVEVVANEAAVAEPEEGDQSDAEAAATGTIDMPSPEPRHVTAESDEDPVVDTAVPNQEEQPTLPHEQEQEHYEQEQEEPVVASKDATSDKEDEEEEEVPASRERRGQPKAVEAPKAAAPEVAVDISALMNQMQAAFDTQPAAEEEEPQKKEKRSKKEKRDKAEKKSKSDKKEKRDKKEKKKRSAAPEEEDDGGFEVIE